ncbi:fungal specific transcription factor domain-containing protein 82 [Elsinoe australis]|uniref:Fungal specific transcription factor domain-containing protein 82 n=1 Tax=Elsinoe australis TaxID=40998 RepID=A0A4U7AQH8_9PEZI|nr:fungal specific transcription factor domain-containing protein 82 [Elsinoe australis]
MKRTRFTKSHGGCSRCKAKRMKCDETKPSCRACIRAGVECPGFAPQFRWSRKHEKFSQPSQQAKPSQSDESGTVQQSVAERSEVSDQASSSVEHFGDQSSGGLSEPAASNGTTFDNAMPMDAHIFDWLDMDMTGFDDLSMSMIQQSLAMADYLPPTGLPGQDHIQADPSVAFQATSLTNNDHSTYNGSDRDPHSHTVTLQQQTASDSVSPSQQTSSSPAASGLLGTFYRLSQPSLTARFSGEHFVNHYFTEVCSLYSCFDSPLNPFRTIVSNLWNSSATIYLSIQSLAVAHIANHYLYMAPLGHVKRSQAWKSLQLDLRLHRAGKLPLENVLISLFLLGLSSSWHRPSDLGLKYLFISRNLVQTHLRSDRASQQPLPNEAFYLDALMYWEMLASFVDPIPMMTFPGYGAPIPQVQKDAPQITPHPWAGINSEIHFALAEVGRLLRRRRRSRMYTSPPANERETPWCDDDEQWAVHLEQYLDNIQIPSETGVVDYQDEYTPKSDLLEIAAANRYIGLLELYAAFPHWLEKRITSTGKLSGSIGCTLTAPVDHSGYTDAVDSWLCAIAVHILDHLKDIAISSAACRLQALILVSCASQLRFPDRQLPSDEQQDSRQGQVFDTREFVESRMLALSRKYPQKQYLQMLDIVKESWQRLDDGSPNAHWLDVAHENGWQTMMG